MIPIVLPTELSDFETWAADVFRNESFNNRSGVHDFGFGVFARDDSGRVYHDVNGTNPSSEYQVLTPSLLANEGSWAGLMFNVHSLPSRSVAMDALLDCYTRSNESVIKDCASSGTGIIQLILDRDVRPSTIVFNSISPDSNPYTLVGFTTVTINWDTVIESALPSSGFDAVILLDSGDAQVSYELNGNKVSFLGVGNHVRNTRENTRLVFELFPDGRLESIGYTITFFATDTLYNKYNSTIPINICVAALLIVLLTSGIFLAYDVSVRREALDNLRILAAKKSYVRFISHVSVF